MALVSTRFRKLVGPSSQVWKKTRLDLPAAKRGTLWAFVSRNGKFMEELEIHYGGVRQRTSTEGILQRLDHVQKYQAEDSPGDSDVHSGTSLCNQAL
jgi:hypothetical protein